MLSNTSVQITVSGPERASTERPTRIAYVASYYPSHTGGLEIVAWQIARLSAERGAIVDLFACGVPAVIGGVPRLRAHSVSFIDPLDRHFGLPVPIWSPRSIRALAATVRSADLIHAHDTVYFGSVLSAVMARWYRIPLVVTVHVSELRFRSRVLNALFKIATRFVSRPILETAEQVAFVGTTAMDYYNKQLVCFRRSPVVIPNGVDREIFHPRSDVDRVKQRKKMGLPQDQPVLLFVGRFVEKKGLLLLKEAAGRLSKCVWVFVGEGPINPAGWMMPHVRTTGRLNSDQIARYYQVADLVIAPGVGEGGITLVVQEAMCCGTPVLVSTEVAMAFGSVQPPGVYAVDIGASDASLQLSGELRRLIAESSALGLVRSDVSRYASRWSWDRTVSEYEVIYQTLKSIHSNLASTPLHSGCETDGDRLGEI